MVILAKVGEQSTVDARVKGLDPTVEALGEAGDIGHLRDSNPCVGDRLRRRTRRHDLHTRRRQSASELDEPRLVINRDQRSADGTLIAHEGSPIRRDRVVTRSSRSCSLMRSCSVASESFGSTDTATCARIGPVSTPQSTTWTVQPVTVTP